MTNKRPGRQEGLAAQIARIHVTLVHMAVEVEVTIFVTSKFSLTEGALVMTYVWHTEFFNHS